MDTLLHRGETLFQEGKLQEAETCFLEFLRKNPDDPDCLNNLGVMAHALKDCRTAEALFKRALHAKPGQIDALLNLSDLLSGIGRREEAVSLLKEEMTRRGHDHVLEKHLAFLAPETAGVVRAEDDGACSPRNQRSDCDSQTGLQEKLSLRAIESSPVRGTSIYRAAFSEVDITPLVSEDQPIFLQGMAGPARRAASVSVPLKMQLLLIEDEHFTKILLVTADLFGFGKEMVDRVRQMAEPWGIQPEGILLNASHTHYAPGTVSHISSELGPYYAQYANAICDTIGQGLDVLYDRLEECEIGVGHADLRIGLNRRLPEKGSILFAPNEKGFYDSFTPFLCIKFKRSEKTVVLVNHGCHPTGLGNLPLISADFVGYMRDALRQSSDADGVMFLQGAAGSSKEAGFCNDGHPRFATSLDDAKRNGTYMAEKIASALRSPLLPVSGPIFCTSESAPLPIKPPPTKETLQRISENAATPAVIREWASKLNNGYPEGDFPTTVPMTVQLITIGGTVRFVGMPGEPVAELAIKLRAGNPHLMSTFILGYTNGLLSYLPTDTMIKEGGYEPRDSSFFYLLPSQLALGTESEIVKALNTCNQRARSEDEPNGYGRHHLTTNPKRAFFVLSSGRCGTLTLANILNTAGNARVWHHPKPYLIRETLLAYRGKIDKSQHFWKARSSVVQSSWADGLIHGETDHNMTPFCEMLADELPMAKFLVLVRDPRDFIRSGLRRKYYQGHDWDVGRLQPEEHTPDYSRWIGMAPFAKVSWLWAQTYAAIQKSVEAIGESRVLLVRFEDLVSSTEKTRQIFDFLELTGFSPQQIKSILALRLNEQKGPCFPRPKDWPEAWNQELRIHCAAVAGRYGYDLGPADPPTVADKKASIQTAYHVRQVNHVPQVGVGLPVYSGGNLLEGAIASVLEQDLEDLELVVLDLGKDPRTREICDHFKKSDSRLRYVNSGEDRDYLGLDAIVRVMNLTNSQYFMWASYDDRHHPSFLRKAVERLTNDSDIALVYFLTRLESASGFPLPSRPDRVRAEMEDPLERFSHVISNLDLCNAFYGLFRRKVLVRCRALRKPLYRAYDNLLLAEIALYGKIVQLGEILFTRRLTRPRNQSFEESNADVIRAYDPSALDDGITLPLCRLVFAHCELIAHHPAKRDERNRLVQHILTCFRERFDSRLRGEIQRALDLVNQNIIYRTWDGREEMPQGALACDPIEHLQLSSLMSRMQEACFLYPDWPQLFQTYHECQLRMAHWAPVATDLIWQNTGGR
jgi:hypothetical protein